jgi:hypothetical protein
MGRERAMGKAVAALFAAFTVGGVSMSLFGGALGGMAESISLGVVGFGLVASSHLMNRKIGAVPNASKELAEEAHA